MTEQRQEDDVRHLTTMEITVDNHRDDIRSCDTSFGSLRSLVSKDGDSLLLDDDAGFEDSNYNSNNESLAELHRISSTSFSTMDRSNQQYSNQRSIATEMAIIASSSPEIKALSDQTITPNYPAEINFDLFEQDQRTQMASSDGSVLRPKYISPLSSSTVERDMVNQRLPPRSAPRPMEREDTFMDDADELAVYMERSTIGGNRPSPLNTGQKENVMPPFSFDDKTPEASNTTRSHGGSFTFKSAMRSETRRHHSLSSMGRRPSYHRRVSFDSLPSPAEITTAPAASQPRPQRRATTTCTYQKSKSFELGTKSPLAMDFPF